MIDRLRELEAAARRLDPGPDERARLLAAVTGYAEDWMRQLASLPGYGPDAESAAVMPGPEPTPVAQLLADLGGAIDAPGVNEGAGHFFGFIPASGIFAGALADYLAAVTSRYAGVRYGAPGAVRLERAMLDWVADLVGFPAGCGGDFTSGGSLAHLSAIVTAREAAGIGGGDAVRHVVYTTDHTHHSALKALRIAGLGEAPVRAVRRDERHRMDAAHLDGLVAGDSAAGLQPWLVIASAGSTDTGAVDPLADIAEIADARRLWLHIDAAYGGAFALVPEGRRILAGMERADSLIVDPHKGFFLPFGIGVVLVRDASAMRRAFAGKADYMQDAAAGDEYSPDQFSPELTRPFRALRLWLALHLAGIDAFRAALEEKLLLARYAHERLAALPGFEVGPPPDLSIVTFRHLPSSGDADTANRRLAAAIQSDGRIYLSSTTIDGAYTLRLAILGARTHLEQVDRAVDVIAELAARPG